MTSQMKNPGGQAGASAFTSTNSSANYTTCGIEPQETVGAGSPIGDQIGSEAYYEPCRTPKKESDRENILDRISRIFEEGRETAGDFNEMRFKLLSDEDLCKLLPMQWRIKKVLPETGLAAVFGPSGSGKSFLVLDMLQSLAAGRNWFGYKSKPCNVLYCALEGEGGIAGRVSAYRIRHGATAANISYLVQSFSLLDSGDIKDLAQAIKATGQVAEVVVLDTLNRAAPGADENDSKSMGQIIAAAKELQTLIGGLVLLVHHTGKDASKGLRGHSSLHAALDAAIEVRRDGDRREWLVAKSKDDATGAAHPFELEIVTLGADEDGEPVTSCIVRPLSDSAEAVKQAKRPTLRSNQKIANEALGEALRKRDPFFVPEGQPEDVPAGRPCIQYAEAVAIVAERIPADAKHKTTRAKTAITGLVEHGYLSMKGEWLWFK